MKFNVPKTEDQKKEDLNRMEDGQQKEDSGTFTLESSLQPMGATYAVAILNQGQLHLNPLVSREIPKTDSESVDLIEDESNLVQPRGGGILQMRPSFSHLNPIVPADDVPAPSKESNEIKKVTVKYQSKKQEKLKNWQKNTYAYKMKELEEEPFMHLKFYHPDKSFLPSDKVDQLFFDSKEEELETPITLSPEEYLDYIVGGAAQPISRTIPYGVCSRSKRESLSLVPQLVQLMKSVTLMQFSRIRQLVSVVCEDTDLIKALEEVAVLIDGIWIVKRYYF